MEFFTWQGRWPCTQPSTFLILGLGPGSGGVVQLTLARQSKFMNNQCIQYPLKRSLKPPESISAFLSMVGNTNHVLTLFLLTQGHSIPDSQKFFPFFHQNFHSNLLRCRLSNCFDKLVQIAIIKRFGIRWQRVHMVLLFGPKGSKR